MKKSRVFLPCILAALVLICSVESSDPSHPSDLGYIFTCPRSLKVGAKNELELKRYGKELCAGFLNVTISYQVSSLPNLTTVEKYYAIKKGARDTFLYLNLDKVDTDYYYIYNGKITINGSFCDYEISGSDSVYFSTSRDCEVLIQTDKPVYKDGQTVLFRVLSINKDLKPCANNLDDIYVTNPQGNRLFEWKDVNLKKVLGMKQFDFPLDNEPQYGIWTIYVKTKRDTFSVTFEVKEYVLPKYEVTIEIPPYTLVTDQEIPIKICAEYTYGEPVNGNLNMSVSLEPYWWSSDKVPTLEYVGEIKGCFEYKINVSLISTTDDYYRRIQVTAIVEEDGTGIQITATQYIQRQYYPFNLNFNTDYAYQFYKPGLPYVGQLFVRYPDNTPVKNEDIQICYTLDRERVLCNWAATRTVKVCSNFTSDCEGNIDFIIGPQTIDSVGITVSAVSLRYAKTGTESPPDNSLYQPQTSISLSAWYSPSGNFMQLQPVEKSVPCGCQKNVRLLFTAKENGKFKFHYQVLSQARVVQSGVIHQTFSTGDDVSSTFEDECKLINTTQVQVNPPPDPSRNKTVDEDCCSCAENGSSYVPPVGEAIIELDVDASWSPSVILLVYYIRPDRETVGDSLKINIAQCFKNQVKMKFKDAVKQPGTNTSITISASSKSLCGIRIVDKSVSLLNPDVQVTIEKVFSIKAAFDTNIYYPVDRCSEGGQPGLNRAMIPGIIIPNPGGWSYSPYQDCLAAFYAAGLLVISDFTLFTRPCKSSGGGNDIVFKNSMASPGIAMDGVAMGAAPEAAAGMGAPAASTVSAVEVRNYFPETWLFYLVLVGKSGKLTKTVTLPHTITQWDGNAICINDKDGLGISNTTSIRGFQAFFLSFTLPYSVIRGEVFTVTLTIFNYVDDALPVTISLDELEGFTVIGESIDGDYCILPQAGTIVKFQLQATKLGEQNITVRAETAQNSDVCSGVKVSSAYAKDAVENSVIVEAEGWPLEVVESTLFCLKDGSLEQVFSFDVPSDVVPDSGRGYFDITGNILGKTIDNLDRLLILPSGCGEQNMAALAPNVVIYGLLLNINQLTSQLDTKIKNNLVLGCQRQLQYQRTDGSFSAFGNVDNEGSMFLTAMTLRYFSKASEIIFIDNSTISSMQKWITSKQQTNGCFPNTGKIFSRGLQGSNYDSDEGVITAYVTTSLLISGFDNETILDSAYSCIANSQDKTYYATFLYAFMEILANKPDSAKERIDAVEADAIVEDGTKYWHDENATKTDDIQTAAYAVLDILPLEGTSPDALAVVLYLIRNLNPYGGFYSTQDTCLGLEALAEYAKLTYADPVQMTLTCTGGGLNNAEIIVNENNKILVQRTKVPIVPSKVTVVGTGTGCVLIQKIVRCNTVTSPEKRNFNLAVDCKCSDSYCNTTATISATVSYLPPNDTTGMALMEVKMISGMTPDKTSLQQLVPGKVAKFDVKSNVINFYFPQITNEAIVLNFTVTFLFSVENPQPGTAIVYDYYNRDISSSTTYNATAM